MISKPHSHFISTAIGPFRFNGCVSPDICNPMAHGDAYTDFCECGAFRVRNSSGFCRDEFGPWITKFLHELVDSPVHG